MNFGKFYSLMSIALFDELSHRIPDDLHVGRNIVRRVVAYPREYFHKNRLPLLFAAKNHVWAIQNQLMLAQRRPLSRQKLQVLGFLPGLDAMSDKNRFSVALRRRHDAGYRLTMY